MYEIYARIERLSERVALLADTYSAYRDHFDPKVRQENLRFNLSFIIARLLINAHAPATPTFELLEDHLINFNTANSSNLAVQHFTDLGWCRKIDGELCFPSLVLRAIWKIRRGEKANVSPEFELQLKCLLEFYERHMNDEEHIEINITTLHSLLTEREINILMSKNLLIKEKEDSKIYRFKCKEDPCRYLRNEIASTVWILLKEDPSYATNEEKFKKFIEIIKRWLYFSPDNLKAFLDNKDLGIIVNQAVQMLLSEEDLIDDGTEFQKSWLDQPQYGHSDLSTPVPAINLRFASPFHTIKSIDSLEKYYQGVFDHSDLRSFYHLLLRIIIRNDRLYGEVVVRYPNVLSLLRDTKRPYLINEIFLELKNNNPEIFPYLLLHPELAPLVFYGLNKVQFSDKTVSAYNQIDRYKALKVQLTDVWKEAYEIFLSTFSNFSVNDEGNALSEILIFQSEQFFYNGGALYQNTVDHLEAKSRFEIALSEFSELKDRSTSGFGFKTRIFPKYLRKIFETLKARKSLNPHEFISLPTYQLELVTQLLKLCDTNFVQGEVSHQERSDLNKLKEEIAQYLSGILSDFFVSGQVGKYNYHTGEIETVKSKRGLSHFGFEIIEWGDIFSHLDQAGLLETFVKSFKASIIFETASEKGKYHDQNRDQFDKLRLFVKSIGLSLLQINREFIRFEIMSSKTNDLQKYLHQLLKEFSCKHTVDDLINGRINIFDDRYSTFENNLYHQDISTIVFNCFNQSIEVEQIEFINDFFENSIDLELLLNALNIFESGKAKSALSAKIDSISIEDFIRSRSTVSQLESSIIEAINSDSYFSFAFPLLEKVESHIKKVNLYTKDYQDFFFRVKLLLAFKRKSLSEMQEILPPEDRTGTGRHNIEAENKKKYFIGLHKLYNENDLTAAVSIFEQLFTLQPDDYELRYRLFHTRVLKLYKAGDKSQILLELNGWNKFLEQLANDKRQQVNIDANVAYTSTIAYAAVRDYAAFDKSIDHLPKAFLYDEDIIPIIFEVYKVRELYELTVPYLNSAFKYYDEIGKMPPAIIAELSSTIDDMKRVARLKTAFSEIISLDIVKLLATIPEKFNGKKHLDEFLLHEIVRAGKIVMQKIKALSDIHLENKYNDLLLAILEFRFAVWGLEISDQSRSGTSSSGIDAGELDFLIKYASDSLAVIEAMILESKNRSKTEEHVLKIEKYLPDARYFFILTYYKGPRENFNTTWEKYKSDVLDITYPTSYSLKSSEVKDVMVNIDVRKIKTGLTEHIDGIKVYHLFFNISGAV